MPLRLNRRMQNVTNEYFQQELTHQADHILELTKDVIPYCVEISDETIKFIYLTGVKADAPEGTRPYELGFNLHYSLEEQKGEKGINFHDYGSVWTRGEEGSKQGASALLATMPGASGIYSNLQSWFQTIAGKAKKKFSIGVEWLQGSDYA